MMRPLTRGVCRGGLVVVCAIAAGLGARASAQPSSPSPSASPAPQRPTFNVTPTMLAIRWGEASTSLLLRNPRS